MKIKIVFIGLFLISTGLIAQEDDKGLIRLYSVPDQVYVKIPELKFKGTLVRNKNMFIENVEEGEYTFIFRYNILRLKKKIILHTNDTLSVVGNFINMKIVNETNDDIRKRNYENKRKAFLQDSIIKSQRLQINSQNNDAGSSDTAVIFGDTLLIEKEFENEEIFYIVEEMPRFNGGDPAIEFRRFIALNLRYPDEAFEKKIKGTVIVQFAIDSRGRLVDATVVAGVDPLLDQEAIRVVEASPLWTPGKQRGKAVKVLFTFPVRFSLM